MDTIEGLLELPGALFRKLFTARHKTFDEILKDQIKNKLIGLCLLVTILIAVAIIFIVW